MSVHICTYLLPFSATSLWCVYLSSGLILECIEEWPFVSSFISPGSDAGFMTTCYMSSYLSVIHFSNSGQGGTTTCAFHGRKVEHVPTTCRSRLLSSYQSLEGTLETSRYLKLYIPRTHCTTQLLSIFLAHNAGAEFLLSFVSVFFFLLAHDGTLNLTTGVEAVNGASFFSGFPSGVFTRSMKYRGT